MYVNSGLSSAHNFLLMLISICNVMATATLCLCAECGTYVPIPCTVSITIGMEYDQSLSSSHLKDHRNEDRGEVKILNKYIVQPQICCLCQALSAVCVFHSPIQASQTQALVRALVPVITDNGCVFLQVGRLCAVYLILAVYSLVSVSCIVYCL